jgi:uncharacterized membrane-anchored protein
MRRKLIAALTAGLIMVAASLPVAAADQPVLTDQQRTDAIIHLNWLQAGTYKLPASNSTIALPEGYSMVRGEDARRLLTLAAEADDATEAVVMSPQFKDEIVFENTSEGYVAVDDWADVDPVKMLDTIRENTEEANAERRRQGLDELHVVGWLQRPTLDRNTATVYWALEGADADHHVVNSIALRLGRDGYERVNWIVDKADYQPVGGQLDVMLRSHSFDQGHQYADHTSGDKVAMYTIAGLVAAVAGAKVAKVAGGVALLVLLKKFGVLIFAVGAAVIAATSRRIKSLFQRSPLV